MRRNSFCPYRTCTGLCRHGRSVVNKCPYNDVEDALKDCEEFINYHKKGIDEVKELFYEHWKELFDDFHRGMPIRQMLHKYQMGYKNSEQTLRHFLTLSPMARILARRKDKGKCECTYCRSKEV